MKQGVYHNVSVATIMAFFPTGTKVVYERCQTHVVKIEYIKWKHTLEQKDYPKANQTANNESHIQKSMFLFPIAMVHNRTDDSGSS